MPVSSSPVSPELVLVDPELRSRALGALPDPYDCLAPRARAPMETTSAANAPLGRASRIRPSAIVLTAALLLIGLVGTPALDLIPSSGTAQAEFVGGDSGNHPASAGSGSRPHLSTTPSRAPDPKKELTWTAVKGAQLYNLVIMEGRTRLIDLWPRDNAVSIDDSGLVEGRRLEPGRYRWFVFPAFGRDGALRFGKAVANGEFVVDRRNVAR